MLCMSFLFFCKIVLRIGMFERSIDFMRDYLKAASDVLAEQKSSKDGLSSDEAAVRLESFGRNKLAEGKKTSLFVRFLKELSDPMTIVLLAAAAVSGVTAAYAHESFADVFIILIVVVINAVLGVYRRARRKRRLPLCRKWRLLLQK